jgi:hypothetical protein
MEETITITIVIIFIVLLAGTVFFLIWGIKKIVGTLK